MVLSSGEAQLSLVERLGTETIVSFATAPGEPALAVNPRTGLPGRQSGSALPRSPA